MAIKYGNIFPYFMERLHSVRPIPGSQRFQLSFDPLTAHQIIDESFTRWDEYERSCSGFQISSAARRILSLDEMTSKPEEIASRCLRAILAPISAGAAIEDSDDFSIFQSAMEHVIPSILEEEYPWWRYESLDGFLFAVARKVGPEEALFIGLCLLISDQTWTPLHLRLRIAPQSDNIEWLVCRLGESGTGNGGMVRTPYGSSRQTTKLLNSVVDRLESIAWAYAITRGSSPHAA